jgi:hypothetical protein
MSVRSVRLAYGVWLPEAIADEPLVRAAAMLERLPAGSVLSGPSAALVHGLWVRAGARLDVTVPATARPPAHTTAPQRPEVAAHRRALRPDEVAVVRGLPVTTLPRTWLDLAATLELPDLVAADDSALRAGATPAELAQAVDRGGGRRGVVRARVALPLLDRRSRSRPESRLRVALVTGGLPVPEVNQPAYDEHGGWLAEPDLSYPPARVALEYQGALHAEVDRMRRDVARHMDLHRAGWQVLYYTAADVLGRTDQVVRDVREALVRRAPELLTRSSAHRVCREPPPSDGSRVQ